MEREQSGLERRVFLKGLLAAGVIGGTSSFLLVRQVLAMGEGGQLLEGVRKIQGNVLINGVPAKVNTIVVPGDVISTGSASFGVIVIGKDAFLVRESSRIEIGGDKADRQKGGANLVKTIKVTAGKMLSVFGKGEKRLETTNAVAGVRGSALYVEAETDLTYLCLCYGEAEIRSLVNPSARETVVTRHHDQPRYVMPKCADRPLLRAPAMNHTDEELIMLEELVGRKPPFVADGGIPSKAY